MATTPVYAIPYPVGTDRVMDGDNAMQAIADRVEAILKTMDPAVTGAPTGVRNVIRNGDMGVAQRGGGPYSTTGVNGVDGWALAASAGLVGTRVTAGMGAGLAANGAAYALQSAVTGQAGAAGDFCNLVQKIEGVRTLAGRQVTLTFVAGASTGTPKIGVEVEQIFGTGGSPSAAVVTTVAAVTISTTSTRYSLTFTVPSVTGKTVGTNGDDYLTLRLWLSAGSTYAARASNIGVQNVTIALTDVQLEAGPIPTPFERMPQQQQLAWCQRYYERWSPEVAGANLMTGTCLNTVLAVFAWKFAVKKRAVVAACSGSAASTFLITNGAGTQAVCSAGPSFTALTSDSVGVQLSVPSGLRAADASMSFTNSAATFLEASAEL